MKKGLPPRERQSLLAWSGQPISRVLSGPDRRRRQDPVRSSISSPLLPRGSSSLPGIQRRRAAAGPQGTSSLLGLAPDGGCLAAGIAACAGSLLHHLFTLTSSVAEGGRFLWPCPRVSPSGCCPASCSLERGLSSDVSVRDRPAIHFTLMIPFNPMSVNAAFKRRVDSYVILIHFP